MNTLTRWVFSASFGLAIASISAMGFAAGEATTVAGEWKEYWGTTGQTDVTYNDHYRVSIDTDGGGVVERVGKETTIDAVELKTNGITFTQHTAFPVKYALSLQSDNKWLVGTATTPKKVVNIRWERIR